MAAGGPKVLTGLDNLEKGLNDPGVKLRARAAPDLRHGLRMRPSGLVRPRLRDGPVRVHDR